MIGKTISHYKVLEKIGEGGMGVVYKAEDTKLKRVVALKFLPEELMKDPEAKERFVQEAQAAAALDHPNICTVHEIEEVEGQAFIAMAYIDGQSLKEMINSGPMEIDRAIGIAVQVAEGLKEAHERGVVHRDVKPANIILTEKEQVKIMDFGLAKLSWGVDLTKTAVIMGTVAYMSPEQAKGEAVDHRTDIWSFGAMFYEMLTGKRPFKSRYDHAILHSVLYEDPAPIDNLKSDVPVEAENIVLRCMQKKPKDRYPNMGSLLKDLKSIPQEDGDRVDTSPVETSEETFPSIAVLPFVNMSTDPENEYFSDGLSESIINVLTQLDNFKVVARTSAFSFKGKDVNIREIGKELNVANVLEGSVQKAGNRLRITAQLISVKDGYHLWSEKFDRTLDDVFAIQDEISLQIVDNLKAKLGKEEKSMLVKRYTDDIEAYNLYLKGRFQFAKITKEGMERALDYFHQVVDKDPKYALAYAGIADCHIRNTWYYFRPPKEELPKALAFAEKALNLDSQLSEAHASLAFTKMMYERDWDGSGKEFECAIDLNPGNSLARSYYSVYFAVLGKHSESIEQAQKALDLDPISLWEMINLGLRYYYDSQFEKSLEQIKKAIDLDPNSYAAHNYSAFPLVCLGRYEEAIQAAQKAEKILGERTPHILCALGLTYSLAGDRGEAEKILEELIALSDKGTIPLFIIPWIYYALDERDLAFEWMERGFEENDPLLMWIKSDPIIKRLEPDQRYHAMLKKLGLDRY
jgi:serine/threonine protein kinase/tetratricopeptide (TPR) repeat protein